MTPFAAFRNRVVVIGGGISGLAAAHRLLEMDAGLEVTLLEAGERLGGVLQTTHDGGYLIEHSADNFITDPPWAVQLCERIGMANELIPTTSDQRGALVVRRGRLERVPPGFMLMAPAQLWPLLTTPLLSTWGKIRLLGEPLVPRRTDGADESLGSFARRRLGREVFERIVQPLVGGIYTADPERLSLRATLPRFLEMERQHGSLVLAARRQRASAPDDASNSGGGARYGMFVAPRDGMASLVEAIAARLPAGCVRFKTRVNEIARDADRGWKIHAAGADGQATETECGGVIVATPAPAAARFLAPLDTALAGELAQIEYAGTAIVTQAYRREQIAHPLDGFGFVVPAAERRQILAGSFASVKFPGRAPEDCVLVRVFVGGACQGELLRLSDDELRRLAGDELRALLGIQGEPLRTSIARWPQAMPQYHVGHCERVARIERATGAWPGLALAGNAYHGVGIPNCVHSGEQAAERVVQSLATSRAR